MKSRHSGSTDDASTRNYSRLAKIITLLFALGCGGGDGGGPTNPSPKPVATVDVSPGTLSLTEGDSTSLEATPRSADGTAVAGKTITWSTNASAVATVSSSGLVSAVSAGSATISATADGKSGTATVTVQPAARMVIDAGSAASKNIGAGGGTLTTTSSGVSYTLDVPPGSLADTKQITMTPVKILRRLPASGDFVAAVKLEPSGTTFFKPLTLRIVSHVSPISGKNLLAYVANDTGAVVTFAPMTQHGDTLVMSLAHFSVGGFAQFVQTQVPPAPIIGSTGSQSFINQIDAARAAGAPMSAFGPIFRSWYFQIVEPEMLGAGTADEYVNAAGDADLWYINETVRDWTVSEILNLDGQLANERANFFQQLPAVLQHGIAALNSRCANSPFGADATRAFVLQSIAADVHIDGPTFGLDMPTVVNGLCLKVQNTIANFPSNPQPGSQSTLDLRYGVKVGTATQLQDQLFKVTMDLVGTTTDGPHDLQTDTQGRMSGNLIVTGTTSFLAQMHACIHPDAGAFLENVCMTHSITRSFVPPSVLTTSLPNATLGTAYSTTLSATGGAGGYLWSLVSGALPGGLSLSAGGVISGTPSATGVFTFTVRVTSNGQSAAAQLTLTVGIETWQLSLSFDVQSGPTSGTWQTTINFMLASQPHLQFSLASVPSSQNLTPPLFFSGTFNANVGSDAFGQPVLSGVTIAGPTLTSLHNGTLQTCQDNDIVLPAPMVTLFGGTLFSGNFPPIAGQCNITYTGLRLERITP